MYLYVEMWNAKPEWLGLSDDERKTFMKDVDDWLGSVMDPDTCSVYGACVNDGDTAPRADYAYLVVWSLKDKSHVRTVADGTSRVGWYKYFDQVNIGGEKITPDDLVAALMTL
jgi:hypothetical protein